MLRFLAKWANIVTDFHQRNSFDRGAKAGEERERRGVACGSVVSPNDYWPQVPVTTVMRGGIVATTGAALLSPCRNTCAVWIFVW